MALASIMVHVDFEEQSEERIRLAAGLAARFNSLLIGVAGWPLRKHDVAARSYAEYPPTEEARQAKILQQLGHLGEMFRRSAVASPRGIEWRSSPHFPSEVIAREARAADLVIVGREGLPDDRYHTYDPGAVILAAGRPVLVVPRGVGHLHASRVLIAWKDTREARRAIHDALPFLKQAQSVDIAAVAPQDLQECSRNEISDVARYLEHHRVAVSQQIATAVSEPDGQNLLRLAEERNADLIVAGAYGRSRLSEWIFGGVTRYLLTMSKVPCLFSN